MILAATKKVTVEELLDDVDGYLLTADPPIVKEFALLHGISRQRLYQIADECAAKGDYRLKEEMQRMIDAKEVMLEKKGLTGEYASTMAIFSLKQLGWSDKVEQKTTAKVIDLSGLSTEELKKILDDEV